MNEPLDPFDDEEVTDIVRRLEAQRVYGAIDEANEEVAQAVAALETLVARLGELCPRAAVVSLITSLAVGTALSGTYGEDQ
jgi:tRNA nucleotidyltransferase (CCA-adding enzyme)